MTAAAGLLLPVPVGVQPKPAGRFLPAPAAAPAAQHRQPLPAAAASPLPVPPRRPFPMPTLTEFCLFRNFLRGLSHLKFLYGERLHLIVQEELEANTLQVLERVQVSRRAGVCVERRGRSWGGLWRLWSRGIDGQGPEEGGLGGLLLRCWSGCR